MVENVLITPVLGGGEKPWLRLEKAIEHTRAATVYLVRMPEELDEAPGAADRAEDKLAAKAEEVGYFEYEVLQTDLASFEETLRLLIEIIEKERAEEDPSNITVHVDGAGAMGAVTTTIAFLLEGIKGIYVAHPEFGDLEVQELPSWLEMDGPVEVYDLNVLREIHDHEEEHGKGIEKKALIDRLQEKDLIREGQDNAYRRLSQFFLPHLKDHGFVDDTKQDPWDRRKRLVEVTEEGRRALEVLEPRLEEPEEIVHIGARAEAEDERGPDEL